MRTSPVVLAIFCCLMGACVRPKLVEPGVSRQAETDMNVVRAYYAAINAKSQAALANLLAEEVQVMVGSKAWGKGREVAQRVEGWTRDPQYSVEITSILLREGVVKARVMVTHQAHGAKVRQEIENTFKVQNSQIIQAILSP